MNIDRYKKDLDALIDKGERLCDAIQHECFPEEMAERLKQSSGDKANEYIRGLPSFRTEYQSWYSEAKTMINQLLQDRLADFTRYYEKPKTRKGITFENYTIEDYLQHLAINGVINNGDRFAAAIPRFRQQLNIVKSVRKRFDSSLFEIRQLAQADLFDSEIAAAEELAKNKFFRAAGVIAGIVLERHLKEVCGAHAVTIRKKAPTVADLNDALKGADVIDTPLWRSIQYLGDLRNLCAHDKGSEPTAVQVRDLLDGVSKVTKTVF